MGLIVVPALDAVVVPVTVTYSSFSALPSGWVDVLVTSGAGAAKVSSPNLLEDSATSTGGKNSFGVFPDDMGTSYFSTTVTVGSASVAATDRGVGPGNSNADGSKGVFARCTAASGTAVISTWIGGVWADQTSSTQVANSGTTLELRPSISGGVVTWSVYKNGGTTPIMTWTDSDHLIDLPGSHPAVTFRHQYTSGTQYPSRGISALTAATL